MSLERTRFRKKITGLTHKFFRGLKPPARLTINEWADKNRILTSEASSEPGRWRTSRFYYFKEPMELISPRSGYDDIYIMGGSQTGKTDACAINSILYYIEQDPCPILYVQKTVLTATRFSNQRIKPAISTCPTIAKLVNSVKRRDGSASALLKSFPGGILMMGGANSAASLRSSPIRILITDEDDSIKLDIDDEGDPIVLAEKRTTNFSRRKRVHISTPGIKETSRIEPLFLSGDQRHFHIPCPYCQFKQVIKFKNIKFTDKDPTTARLQCQRCEELIEERHKTWMLENGVWIAENPGAKAASFHINALYSPLPFYSWEMAVREFLTAQDAVKKGDKTKLKVFVNTVLAETWEEGGKSLVAGLIGERREIYPAEVPGRVQFLTCGVDVQGNRLELEVVGWGQYLENWGIDYRVIMGDPEHDEVWRELDKYLNRNFEHESGHQMKIGCTGIDCADLGKRVYKFCAPLEHRRIFAVRGHEGWGKGYIQRPTKRNEDGAWMFTSWVNEIKSKIFGQLSIDPPAGHNGRDPIPGYCHFPKIPSYDDNYFEMLTSEKLVDRQVGGFKKLMWVLQPGRRNEALDCRGLNIAALNIINPKFDDIVFTTPIPGQGPSIAPIPRTPPQRRTGVLSSGIE